MKSCSIPGPRDHSRGGPANMRVQRNPLGLRSRPHAAMTRPARQQLEEMEQVSVVYTVGDCPVGCGGDDLVVLRARTGGGLFLFCRACGVAYRRKTVELDELLEPIDLARQGVEFPSREDVVRAFGANGVRAHAFTVDDFSEIIALTYLASDQPEAALRVVDSVIATWHSPPDRGHQIRDLVRRRI